MQVDLSCCQSRKADTNHACSSTQLQPYPQNYEEYVRSDNEVHEDKYNKHGNSPLQSGKTDFSSIPCYRETEESWKKGDHREQKS